MKKWLLLIFTIATLSYRAQDILINYDVDTTIHNVAGPLKFWIEFLKTKDDSTGAKYWNDAEVKKYGDTSYFLLENELDFGMDNFLELLSHSTIKVLQVKQNADLFKISSFMEFKPEAATSNVPYMFHVYVKGQNGSFKLYNAIGINTELYLNHATIGYIRYHYPKSHTFNRALAQKQSDFVTKFAKDFDVQPDTVQYYFGSNHEELDKIKGLDFITGNSGEQLPFGKADAANKIVYSSGLGEYYPHEVIHVLLYKKYKKMHLWFEEGTATYFGMSRGKDLDWHLKKVNAYLLLHPELDLNDLTRLQNMDATTAYKYALGGFLIQYAYEKGGYPLIKTLLNAGNTDAEFYNALKEHLGLEQSTLNTFFRSELKKRYEKK